MPVTFIKNYKRLDATLITNLRQATAILLNKNGISRDNVNIVLTDDREIAYLNQKYRNKIGTTNVLSFPFSGVDDEMFPNLPNRELGDIVISVDTAKKEASEFNQSLLYRLTWLITHGLLHLLGYDHEISDADADDMFLREKLLLNETDISRRSKMINLAVNVDHIATIRQARGTTEPDPVTAAALCELAGANGIVVHLREDRRHIQDRDVRILRETVQTKLNLEMGAAKEIIAFALDLKPDMVTLVPEKRQELTTEGGLDVVSQKKKIAKTIEKMTQADIPVSLFIDPDLKQIKTAYDIGATFVEIHTGRYADAVDSKTRFKEFDLIQIAAEEAFQLGLRVNAGHGLDYANTATIAALDTIEELSIGHAIISRAVFVGLEKAVREMKKIISKASSF